MTLLSLDITDPTDALVDWWSEAPGLKNVRRVDFRPGLNVLFAPNGFGKSTILQVLATSTHCWQGGPPVFTRTSFEPWARGRGKGVKLTHDSGLCFFSDPGRPPGLVGGMAGFDHDFLADGIMGAMSGSKTSSGQWCVWSLNRIAALAAETKTRPDRTGHGLEKLIETPMYQAWAATQVSVGGRAGGPPTLLLDEFDRSLDLPMKAHVWALLSVQAQLKQQVIVASHDPMVLTLADRGLCHLIDLCPGYEAACRSALQAFTAHIESAARQRETPGERLAPCPMPFEWRRTTGAPLRGSMPRSRPRTRGTPR